MIVGPHYLFPPTVIATILSQTLPFLTRSFGDMYVSAIQSLFYRPCSPLDTIDHRSRINNASPNPPRSFRVALLNPYRASFPSETARFAAVSSPKGNRRPIPAIQAGKNALFSAFAAVGKQEQNISHRILEHYPVGLPFSSRFTPTAMLRQYKIQAITRPHLISGDTKRDSLSSFHRQQKTGGLVTRPPAVSTVLRLR